MSSPRRISLRTHHRVEDTREAVAKLVGAVRGAGGEVIVDQAEADKHALDGCTIVEDPARAGVDVAVVLGGGGTMLTPLRGYAGTGGPVFTFKFGAGGFLPTRGPPEIDDGLPRPVEGGFQN